MKIRKFLFLLALIFVILLLPNVVNAEDFTFDDIEYDIIDANSVKLSAFKGYSQEVVIPQVVQYNENTYNVTEIGEYAFEKCNSLTDITIPNSVTIIGENAFLDCKSLTSITIPDSVTEIRNNAFSYCISLSNITLSNSLTTIGEFAFEECSKLKNITIPDTVTTIEYAAFAWCGELEKIEVEEGNVSYCSIEGVLFNYDKTKLIRYPSKKEGTIYEIPDTVTSIASFAFNQCALLKDIQIPNSVEIIQSSAFDDCSALTIVTIPDSVITIENYAFVWCRNLTRINIPNSVTTMGDDSIFWGSDSLIIFCDKGSYAEEFAKKYNIEYKPIYYYSVINKLSNISISGVSYTHPEEGDYVATLTANEGYKLPETISVRVGDITLNSEQYTYDFETGNLIIPTLNITENISIEAIASGMYKVTFDANGGKFSNGEKKLIFDNSEITDYDNLEKPTREGYEFVGFFTEKKGGTSLEHYLAEAGIDADLTFYAQWKEVEKDQNKENTENNPNDDNNNINMGNTTTDDSTNNSNSNNPQTGDNILLFVGILVISVIGIYVTTKLKKYTK